MKLKANGANGKTCSGLRRPQWGGIESDTLPNWMGLVLGHLPDETYQILVERLLYCPAVENLLKRAAKPNAYQHDPVQDAKDAKDVKALRVWAQILSSPIEKLPTLLGVREDLDELIGERMKK